ncbi:class I adenylate-forming enzyme family protein [Rhodococcus wratislaviensis]|uniref:class I adenylate-forming enzyme family protein n=1 Tax=Rhodococcus wratislaviensis TaxID=44752 RepID=UPI003659ED91
MNNIEALQQQVSSSGLANTTMITPLERAKENGAADCLRDSRRSVTNEQFAFEVAALAQKYADLGVGVGDTVAVMMPNCVEIATAMFAAWWSGAALTPVNPALTDDEVSYQLSDSKAKVLVSDSRGQTLAAGLGIHSVAVETLRAGHYENGAPLRSAPLPTTSTSNALIIYTSGTTGRPKGCVLDVANIDAMVTSLVAHFDLGPSDRSLVVLPLFHCNGLLISVLSVLLAGGDAVIAPRFDTEQTWELIEQTRPTFFSAVPTMYAMLDERTTREVDASSLRFAVVGGAPMPKDLIGRFEQRFGFPLVEAYGLSECSVVATCNPVHGVRKPGTVGQSLPGQRVSIRSEDGTWAARGDRGEVLISGPNVMQGYLGNEEATGKALRDGWLHTGDVGYLDEDGYLVLVDRLKEMIIRGGENIYPKEIETVLYEHPAVLEAAVVGRPDEIYGEVPVGYIALRRGHALDSDELRSYCLAKLAKYKTPRQFYFLDSLPKNAVGKLTKQLLPSE